MARAKKVKSKDEEKEKLNTPDPIESDEEAEEESSGSDDDQDSDDEDNVDISSEEIKHAIALATAAANKKFGWGKESKLNGSGPSNPLSDIIPGYIAPMTLDSSSLDKFKNPKRLISSASKSVTMEIPNKPSFSSKNFKVSKRDPIDISKNDTNAGSGWFNFEAAPNTSAMQADIAIIRNRNYIDPKKFYKASDFNKRGSHMVQMGTVIEGAMESVFSNRLTKKQRKENVLEEIMGETFGSKDDYVKRKFTEGQREKSEVGRASSKKSKGKGRYRGNR